MGYTMLPLRLPLLSSTLFTPPQDKRGVSWFRHTTPESKRVQNTQ
jgi:hypothetical protein